MKEFKIKAVSVSIKFNPLWKASSYFFFLVSFDNLCTSRPTYIPTSATSCFCFHLFWPGETYKKWKKNWRRSETNEWHCRSVRCILHVCIQSIWKTTDDFHLYKLFSLHLGGGESFEDEALTPTQTWSGLLVWRGAMLVFTLQTNIFLWHGAGIEETNPPTAHNWGLKDQANHALNWRILILEKTFTVQAFTYLNAGDLKYWSKWVILCSKDCFILLCFSCHPYPSYHWI